jgi:Cof subfamily protein (haloacid dehalogenase superfamily)
MSSCEQDKRYRLVAIDLDGTLLSANGTVSEAARAAVRRALEAGLLICFATGRNWTESRTVLDAVEHYGTAVFVGGAMVVDVEKKVTVHRTMMQPQLARELCGFLEGEGHAPCALQDTQAAGVDYLISADADLDEATRHWIEVTDAVVRRIKGLAAHSHEHAIRVGICSTPTEVRRVRDDLVKRFGERVICHSLFVPAYGVEVLEAFDPAVNKWEGILHVARRHGIEASEIIAVGDDVNDLPMIRGAGLGVAMGNARPEVLAIADRVIGRNDQDGLATFLNELVDRHRVVPEERQVQKPEE